MKKIVALLLSMTVLFSLFTTAFADEFSAVNYYVEYGEGTATVIFQAASLDAFDFGIIYDPNNLTVQDYDYSDLFYEFAADTANYTAAYVKNDKAVDNVGNSTYVVFTGAIMQADSGSHVAFAERDLASVTFTDIDEGDQIGVVIGTSRVEDVKNAQKLGAVDLYEQIEIGNTALFDNAIAEPDSEDSEDGNSGNNSWMYGVIIGVIVIAAVVIVLMSKKNSLDVTDKNVQVDDDEDEEE